MVTIRKQAYQGMIEHGEAGFPHEICGVLIGSNGAVETFKPCNNLNTERAHDRYQLDKRSFNEADTWARENGMDIIGIYHTHPDHPSRPSETDRVNAWPEYIYLIISINNGKYNDGHAWMLKDFDSHFEEAQYTIVD